MRIEDFVEMGSVEVRSKEGVDLTRMEIVSGWRQKRGTLISRDFVPISSLIPDVNLGK